MSDTASIQFMITNAMKATLVDELEFRPEEVDVMRPEIAKELIEKKMKRPFGSKPMPEAWKRDYDPNKGGGGGGGGGLFGFLGPVGSAAVGGVHVDDRGRRARRRVRRERDRQEGREGRREGHQADAEGEEAEEEEESGAIEPRTRAERGRLTR